MTKKTRDAAQTWRISYVGLIALVLVYMTLVGAGCALIFRWTNAPADETQYSKPLRTRGGTAVQ